MAWQVERPTPPEELTADQRRRAEAVRQLLSAWLADDSGYAEYAWPALKRGLAASRTSSRPLL
jgi:hypothetical protein